MLAHRFSLEEMEQATGLAPHEIAATLRQVPELGTSSPSPKTLKVMPYPGGRHPRIGFLDGAIAPQRETKISVFTPWDDSSYVVHDIPEAIWSNLGLTYLAHTHVDTVWTRQGITLPPKEWEPLPEGGLRMWRRLPNGITFGTLVEPQADHVRMVMWLHNGTDTPLSDLRVQNCVMLKGAPEFNAQTNDNKVITSPFVACRSSAGQRWVISAWEPCDRPWANPPVPCLHSDPKFPDTAPGETTLLNGWLSFAEGEELEAVLDSIPQRWRKRTLEDIQQHLPAFDSKDH
jgi:hypothetical protein